MKMKKRWIMLMTAAPIAVAATLAAWPKVEQTESYIYGMESYVYGFPLVVMDVTREVITATPKSGEYKAPVNQFARIRTYVNPDFKDVVRISVNSLWSYAFLDLDKEPMIVTIPDSGDRYLVMQALNMWTDDFASVGTRTPQTKSGNFLIAGPRWNGAAPQDIKETFTCSTRYAWVLVQMACASPKEYPEIHALQDELKVTPLSAWGRPYTPPSDVPVDPNADLTATPFDQVRIMTGEMFFKRLAKLLKENPPYPADAKAIERLRKIGIQPGRDFDPNKLGPDLRKGINKAPAEVWLKLAAGPYQMNGPNGWLNLFDLGRYGTDYQTRALIAYAGLGALRLEEAVYPCAFVDGEGKVLDGAQKYIMHFEKNGQPPSHADVWSISPYRENFYVRNAIMKRVLIFAALAETGTGLALLIVPALVGRLLVGEELSGIAISVGRVAGIALIGLGIACWPGTPLAGMSIYSAAVTLYFAYLGIGGVWAGSLLWPAVFVHAVLTLLLVRTWIRAR